jgi:hypothetical protein
MKQSIIDKSIRREPDTSAIGRRIQDTGEKTGGFDRMDFRAREFQPNL